MLTYVNLENCCQHEKTSVDLDAPVVAVIGPNGCGKSNLFKSIYYAITGDHTYLGGSAANRIGASSVGSVTVGMQLDGADYEIYRRLPASKTIKAPTTGKARYLRGGDVNLESDDDIRAEIEGWFGLPVSVLSEFVFVQQDTLCNIIRATPSNRMRSLSVLAGLDRAEAAWEALGAYCNISLPDNSAVIASVKARIASTDKDLDSVEYQLAALSLPAESAVEDADAIIAQADTYASYIRQRDEYSARVAELSDLLEKSKAESVEARRMLEDLHHISDMANYAAAVVRQWDAYLEHERYSADIRRIEAEVAVFKNVPVPSDSPACPAELDALVGEEVTLRKLAAACGPCPTCGSNDAELQWRRAEAAVKLNTLDHLRETYAKVKAEHTSQLNAYQAAKRGIDKCNVQLVMLGNFVKTIVVKPDVPLDEAQAAVNAYAAIGGAKELQRRTTAHIRSTIAVKNTEDRLNEANQKLAALAAVSPPNSSAVASARKIKDRYNNNYSKFLKLSADKTSLTAVRNSDVSLLSKLEADQATSSTKIVWAEKCCRVRQALHRTEAPAAAAHNYVRDTIAPTNNWLEVMKADFRIDITPTCEMLADFGGSKSAIPVKLLSGGQTAVLAWAWRAAMQDVSSGKLWLLCMDEPTYGIDDNYMDALINAIDGWRNSTDNRQLILVTHDTRLEDACDKVVHLGTRRG